MKWTLVADQKQLEDLLREHTGADAVAIDTEFMRRNTFFPKIALLQLCFDDHAFLVDPLALEDVTPIVALFEDSSIVKVLHSASEDLEVFDHWLGVMPRPLFDTQRAYGLLDQGFGIGYRGLVEARFGVELEKGETRSDWLQRPLSQSQCDYAALDVAYLLPLYRALRDESESVGKLDWVFEEGETACAGAGSENLLYYLRIKSAWKLSTLQLATLIAICNWREREAQSRDKPRSWILDDQACCNIARQMPQSARELALVPDIPPAVARRQGDALLACVAEAQEIPESELPAALPLPLDTSGRKRLKALKARSRALAESLGVAPELLLAGKDYELLLREAAGEQVSEPASWTGWRSSRVLAPLRSYLAGESS